MKDISAHRRSRSGVAFIIEALILLVFLAGSLAVLMQLFADSYLEGTASKAEARAIQLASNAAERFSADPGSMTEFTVDGDYFVYSPVRAQEREAGTFYTATIMVFDIGNASGRQRFFSLVDDSQVIDTMNSVSDERGTAPAGPAIEGLVLDYDSLDQIVAEAPLIYQLETARYVNEVV